MYIIPKIARHCIKQLMLDTFRKKFIHFLISYRKCNTSKMSIGTILRPLLGFLSISPVDILYRVSIPELIRPNGH